MSQWSHVNGSVIPTWFLLYSAVGSLDSSTWFNCIKMRQDAVNLILHFDWTVWNSWKDREIPCWCQKWLILTLLFLYKFEIYFHGTPKQMHVNSYISNTVLFQQCKVTGWCCLGFCLAGKWPISSSVFFLLPNQPSSPQNRTCLCCETGWELSSQWVKHQTIRKMFL